MLINLITYKRVAINSIKGSLFILLVFIDFSCIERYYLDKQIGHSNKIVVDALITDQSESQQILLAESSSPEKLGLIPLSNCIVTVSDDKGNEFIFNENKGKPGMYLGTIEKQHLENGAQLMLNFITEDGTEYASDFEEFMPCPPVDSIYYELKSLPTADPEIDEEGLQFYLDFNAPEDYGRFYRWQIDETWEYHSVWPIRDYLDENNVYHNSIANYSWYICYSTEAVDEVFLLSTEGFIQNQYKKYPLHFVNDHTQRLLYRYSLLVKQYSLSEAAYYFWENLKKNNQESGGIFDSQPALVKGNVYNINNPDEEVLGYFGLSSMQTKRIIMNKVTELSFKEVPSCDPMSTEYYGLPGYRPVYFVADGFWGESYCFDCRLRGGTTIKPAFWDD